MAVIRQLVMNELEAGLDTIRRSPNDQGVLKMIVRRPDVGQREVLDTGELSLAEGLVGDSWQHRAGSRATDGDPHPETQINVMNSRVAELVAQGDDRWPLAGDQLFLDLDLSIANLPPTTRLALGSAVIEVAAPPHTGCGKFVERFGLDAQKFVNSTLGRQLRLRGLNAMVVEPGTVSVGDIVRKVG